MQQAFQQRKTRRGWELRKGWTRKAASLVVAVGALSIAHASYAQTDAGASVSMALANEGDGSGADTPQAHPSHAFTIGAGPLTEALEAYRNASGLKLHIKVAADELVHFQTAGVQGVLAENVALQQLLNNTGLSFHFQGSGDVEIGIRNQEKVDVTSSVEAVGLQQFPQPLLDTAQTVATVPEYILQGQADTSLRDGLRNVPGISIAAGEGGSQGDNLTIRGFSARNDIFLDGIRDFGSYYRDSFDYQSIDVLEGPASVEFGRGSTGGIVNQETKQPELSNFVRGNAQFGTDAMRRVNVDINEPLKNIPGGTAFRLNVVGEATNVSERNVTKIRRFGIAPSLAFGLNTKTRYLVSYLHESENTTPDYGLPYFGPAVAPVDRSTFYGFANDNYLLTSPDILTGKVEHDFGLHLTLRNTLRWANYPRNVRITEPQVNTVATAPSSVTAGAPIAVQCAITNSPATSCYPLNTPLSQVTVKRNQLVSNSTEDTLWDQVSATGRFNVAHIANSAVVIVEGGRERSRPTRNSYTLPYVPLVNPDPYDAFAPTATYTASPTHVETQSYGVGFLDTINVTRWLQASGGVRFDYFSTQASNAPTATATPYTYGERLDKQPTYRAAVVVKPKAEGSIYFDYGTSFNPSSESLSLSANNAVSPPEYNETYELGGKWAYLHDRLNLNGSVFRTEKLNARETDPNNSNNVINAGNQLVRGVQLGVLGHMSQNFDLILGYAFLDSKVESSIVNASPFAAINLLLIRAHDPRANTPPYFISPAGYALANVPKNSGNIWVTHRLAWRFSGGVGGSYVGSRRASSTSLIGVYTTQDLIDPANVPLVAKAIPGYAMLNAMLRRPISDRLELQVNVNNLTNKFFIDQPHPNHLVPGEGLNGQFGVNYKF